MWGGLRGAAFLDVQRWGLTLSLKSHCPCNPCSFLLSHGGSRPELSESPSCLHASSPPSRGHHPSGTISPNELLFLKLPSVLVSCHSPRRVANALLLIDIREAGSSRRACPPPLLCEVNSAIFLLLQAPLSIKCHSVKCHSPLSTPTQGWLITTVLSRILIANSLHFREFCFVVLRILSDSFFNHRQIKLTSHLLVP